MGKARKPLFVLVTCLVLLQLIVGAAAAKPSRVMIVVMDQMQPGYAQQFGMTNVLWLQNKAVNFPNAYVGHMASETVVSHNVMVSGLFPKHMGWSDEAFRDVDNVLGYGDDAIVTTGDLGFDQYVKLIESQDYPKLGDYLHEKFPGTIVANVGQKGYQVESMAASSSDFWVRMGSKKKTADLADPSVVPWTGTYRGPSGKRAPTTSRTTTRFLVSVGNAERHVGTTRRAPAWLYPEDGRYVVGTYEDHQSGDNWVADAAIKIMENEDWSGLWVTFSSIDKIGHMWGGGADRHDGELRLGSGLALREIHMPWVAKNADEQLGRLIAKLKELGHRRRDADRRDRRPRLHLRAAPDGFKGVNAYDGGNTTGTPAPGTRATARSPEHQRRLAAPQAADGHRQRGLQLPVHGHRDLAQGPQHGQEA